MTVVFAALVLVLMVILFSLWRRQVAIQRAHFIRHFELPRGLFMQLQKRHPGLTLKQCQLVAQGLRQFFLAHLASGLGHVSMPSQVADDLWHEFILFTRNCEVFCRRAFGAFLHHTPAVVLTNNRQANAGLRRVWWHSCREENIHPARPTRLPLIFALDAKLGIADGFRHAPDCHALRFREGTDQGSNAAVVFCAGDFASDSVDGSTEGFGEGNGRGSADSSSPASADSTSDSGDGGGDGGSSSDGGGCDGGSSSH